MTTQVLTEREYTLDEMTVLSEDGVDVFHLNLVEDPGLPPYYLSVDGRRFAFSGRTYLIQGHGAVMPRELTAEMDEGRLPIIVEREDRYYLYLHDAAAEAAAAAEDAAGEAAE